MKGNLNLKYLSKQDFSKTVETNKQLFSFGNGPWRFT